MTTKLSVRCVLIVVACLVGTEVVGNQPTETGVAWTLDSARRQLQLYPKDPYLQYVVLQLARQEGRLQEVEGEMRRLLRVDERRSDRSRDVDLFGIFSGALAVQESLQLDTMVGQDTAAREGGNDQRAAESTQWVPIQTLQGPTIQSHPWTEMLKGRSPDRSELAYCVPTDFYFVRFQSVNKLLTVAESGDIWAAHVVSQTAEKAYSHKTLDRVQRQLAVEVSPLVRPFYDLAVGEVAITGSDLFATEGSDVTLLFRLLQAPVFRAQMDAYLDAAAAQPNATRSTGSYRDVPFVHVTSPDRSVHVFSAYPREDLHVRSNSQVAFQRILDAIANAASGVETLGDSEEFAYIRTLMPLGAEQEDGFIYLSDPFIRHMVGPQLKLTERRRRLCKNHLHMISHAALLYRTQFGKAPESLAQLARSGCAPAEFGRGQLSCPCQGTYSLSEDGLAGVCSHHGRPGAMVPCCEIPLQEVKQEEAEAYRRFERQYSQYWRRFFDPIAIRIQAATDRYRLETIVLPLIDNSLYTGLSQVLGGEPAMLEIPPVPDTNIFSLVAKLDKERLLDRAGWTPPERANTEGQTQQWQINADAEKMRQIAIAMYNYHDVNKCFPTLGSFDDQKKPLLSWRVHLLPFLEQGDLYRRFHLDEPWDSEHNRQLLAAMPEAYRSSARMPDKAGATTFQRVVGPNTLCTGTERAIRIRDIEDGTANTIMLVDAGQQHAVEWTKPEDLPFDKQTLRKAIFERFEDTALVGFSDGSVRKIPSTVTDESLLAVFTRAGAETTQVQGQLVPSRRPRFTNQLSQFVGPDFEYQLGTFLTQGIGDKLGFHVCDTDPTFDFQLIGFLGQSLGSFSGRRGLGIDDDFLPFVVAIASLNAPVYISLPLEDTDITDQFLAAVDSALARYVRMPERGGFFRFDKDFYTLPLNETTTARSLGMQVGPVKWRFFWARIGDALYIASKHEVLEQLVQAASGGQPPNVATQPEKSHAMLRIRPEHWNRVLPSYRLGWAERHRISCLHNVGRLSNVARLQAAGYSTSGKADSDSILEGLAEEIYGVHFFCPAGGNYVADGTQVTCSVHGSAAQPRQSTVPREGGAIDKMLREFKGLTVGLTFLEDGLHAVVTIDR